MKLLLDQGLPRSAVAELSARGIVAEHVGDLGLAAATDEAILEKFANIFRHLNQLLLAVGGRSFH